LRDVEIVEVEVPVEVQLTVTVQIEEVTKEVAAVEELAEEEL
jgi:hypothetical protein